MPTEILK